MSTKVTEYVCSALGDDSQINPELLLTTRFLLEKWKKDLICGPDEGLADLLEKEEFDDESMAYIRELLIRFASQTKSVELFAQAVGVLELFGDERDVPLFQTWLLEHTERLVRQNHVFWTLFLNLQDAGEEITDRSSLGITDIEANLMDARKYLKKTFGVSVPW